MGGVGVGRAPVAAGAGGAVRLPAARPDERGPAADTFAPLHSLGHRHTPDHARIVAVDRVLDTVHTHRARLTPHVHHVLIAGRHRPDVAGHHFEDVLAPALAAAGMLHPFAQHREHPAPWHGALVAHLITACIISTRITAITATPSACHHVQRAGRVRW